MANKTILIIAGGTGGHVMPALAVASELKAQGITVHWMGTQSGIESRVLKNKAIPLHFIDIKSLRGKGFVRWLQAPFQISKAIIQSIKVIRAIKPDAVLSMGGYVSGPGSLAAWLCRRPLIIHEQNAAPGLTNRLLAPFATSIMTGFPNVFLKHAKKTHHTGNPVRLCIMAISKKEEPLSARPIRLLIIGGSLGAQVLNQVVPQALASISPALEFEVWHQSGDKQFVQSQLAYQQQNRVVKVEPFIEDMAKAYAWADCVICRAGALTVSELAACGIASILVPLPNAADDHQTKNAKYLAQVGAASLLPQTQLNVTKLSALLSEYLKDLQALKAQGQKALTLAKPNATQDVVHHLLNII